VSGSDEIRLVIPADDEFHQIAHLVTGGLAARQELTLEALEDLQVALGAVLGMRDDEDEITVILTVDDGAIRMRVGPFVPGTFDELERDSADFGLRRVLETVSDSFEVEESDGGSWIELAKRAHTQTSDPVG